jgi:hypothetical protein
MQLTGRLDENRALQRSTLRLRSSKIAFALAVLVAFLGPFALLKSVDAAAQSCGSPQPPCNTRVYIGQKTPHVYYGIRGWLGFPSNSLADPTKDSAVHWLGMVSTPPPGWAGGTLEWLQVGAVNGFSNGANVSPRTSLYNYYAERQSWCLGTAGSAGNIQAITPLQVSSSSRWIGMSYTGETSTCGGGPYVLFKTAAYVDYTTLVMVNWHYRSVSRVDANSEFKALSGGGKWNPVGNQASNNGVCYGGYFWGFCSSSPEYSLQRSIGGSWNDWASNNIDLTNASSWYRKNTATSWTRFFVDSTY